MGKKKKKARGKAGRKTRTRRCQSALGGSGGQANTKVSRKGAKKRRTKTDAKKKKSSSKGELTPLQERFCEEYLVDLNATKAYTRAGYSGKGARTSASKLLANPNIQQRIKELRKKDSKRIEITRDEVLAELKRIGFSDIKDFLEFGKRGVIFKESKGEVRKGGIYDKLRQWEKEIFRQITYRGSKETLTVEFSSLTGLKRESREEK